MPTHGDSWSKDPGIDTDSWRRKPETDSDTVSKTERKTVGEIVSSNLTRQPEDIALAAYYRAEKRGFEPGHEIEDWLAAEAELAEQEK